MTDRTMTLDGGKLPMQMDRVDEILNSAEIGIYGSNNIVVFLTIQYYCLSLRHE